MFDRSESTSSLLKMDFKIGGRSPKCTRCRNHGTISDLRGHKHKCFYRDCSCEKCLISSDKQRATADRIALFRQQVRETQQIDKDERKKRKRERKSLIEHPKVEEISSTTENVLPILIRQNDDVIENSLQKQVDYRTKNIDILKYIFPFCDSTSLNLLLESCHDDLLQGVLKISSSILDGKQVMSSAPPDRLYHHSPKTHLRSPCSLTNEKCCESPYCPVNSYRALCRRDSLVTPSTTTSIKRFSFNERDIEASKRMKMSPNEHSIVDMINESPYCTSCKRLGAIGDKFCPLCGILF